MNKAVTYMVSCLLIQYLEIKRKGLKNILFNKTKKLDIKIEQKLIFSQIAFIKVYNAQYLLNCLFTIQDLPENFEPTIEQQGESTGPTTLFGSRCPTHFSISLIELKIGMVTNQDTRNPEIMLPKLENNGKMGY